MFLVFLKGGKMYKVTAKGRTLEELKKAVNDLNDELNHGLVTQFASVEKILESHNEEVEEMEEVESPFVGHNTVIDNEVDSEGIPWDSRIHASSKAKVKDGTFKIKRGVSDAEANTIKAELKARVSNAVVTTEAYVPQVAAPVLVPAPAIQETPVYTAPVTQAPVVAPAAAPIPTFPQMNAGHTVDTFKTNFALVVANLITEGKIDQAYVNSLKDYFKIQEIWQANDEQKAQVFEQFVQYGFVQKVG
jgi:hypothetical protein